MLNEEFVENVMKRLDGKVSNEMLGEFRLALYDELKYREVVDAKLELSTEVKDNDWLFRRFTLDYIKRQGRRNLL